LLQLFDALNPFEEFGFVDTPLVTDFDSREFLALDHAFQRSHGNSQQFSSLLESQTAQLIKVLFCSRFSSQPERSFWQGVLHLREDLS